MIRQKILILIAVCVLFIFHVSLAHAQEAVSSPAAVAYDLPYPGLLPDSFFYPLKAAKDKLQAIFISNPLQRAEFDLEQTDKRIAAGYTLATDKQKPELAEMTISKGENYYEDAIVRAQDAKKQGTNISEFIKKMTLANKKHREIISSIENGATGDIKKKLTAERERAEKLGEAVKTISK